MKRAKPKTYRQSQPGLQPGKRKADTQSVSKAPQSLIRCVNARRQRSRKTEALQPATESIPVAASALRVNRRAKPGLAGSPSARKTKATPARQGRTPPVTPAEFASGTAPESNAPMTPGGESLAARRRRMREEAEARQTVRAREVRPEGVDAYGLSPEQQRAAGLEVLAQAYGLLERGEASTLRDAVQSAGEGGIRAHYATRLLLPVLGEPVARFDARHPSPLLALSTVAAAIRTAGGTPPAPLRGKPGPKVRTTPPTPEEVAERRRLYAAGKKGDAK